MDPKRFFRLIIKFPTISFNPVLIARYFENIRYHRVPTIDDDWGILSKMHAPANIIMVAMMFFELEKDALLDLIIKNGSLGWLKIWLTYFSF